MATKPIGSISIDGASAYVKTLRNANGSLPDGVKAVLQKAAKIVVDDARPGVPIGPGRNGHAASSIRVTSTSYTVKVEAGGKKFPYYPWLDFGGSINKHTSKPTRRPFIKGGRFIWASWDRRAGDVVKAMADGLETLIDDAGLR